jgi:aryl-alcohol dehydrogenase-like predicted oxidoreductase
VNRTYLAPLPKQGGLVDYGRIAGIDKPISRLVQGTSTTVARDQTAQFAVFDAFFAAGGTAIDTARHYGDVVESILGRWIADRGVRDRVVIVGKGAHPKGDVKRVTPADIAADLDESLRQMGVDEIDLYLLHRDDPDVPVGPIVEALDGHRRAGKIRAYGGSNWSPERLAEANAYAAAHGLTPFAAGSPNFSLAEWVQPPWPGCTTIAGAANAGARAWYEAERLPVVAWSSLAGGFFSGRFRRDNLDSFADYLDRVSADSYGTEENFQRLDRAEALATARDLTVPQVALAYLVNQPPLEVFPIVGARTPDEVAQNAMAFDVRLTPEEVAWLDLRRDASPLA